jgi:hypothetical protein
MMEGLAACFAGLADPRETRRCDHRLIDILVIAVCAVIACAESWEDIELYGRSKQAWLKTQGKRMIEFYSPTGPAFGRHSSNERGSLRLVRSHPT